MLGAKFNENKSYFDNPYDLENKVYILLDPVHMIKLIRNFLAKARGLTDGQGYEISFRFLEELVSLQIIKNINLSNKLTKTHIDFQNVKMRVRIACETISNSSANAIEFLDKKMKHEKFANSFGTTQFLRTFDSSFDIMNSKKGRPICAENLNEITAKFNCDKEYIKGLTTLEKEKRVSVLNTKSYTPFLGFIIAPLVF